MNDWGGEPRPRGQKSVCLHIRESTHGELRDWGGSVRVTAQLLVFKVCHGSQNHMGQKINGSPASVQISRDFPPERDQKQVSCELDVVGFFFPNVYLKTCHYPSLLLMLGARAKCCQINMGLYAKCVP